MRKGASKSTAQPANGTAKSRQDAFVLGRVAFRKISAVEGITPSDSLDRDLDRLAGAPAGARRAELARKYGKG